MLPVCKIFREGARGKGVRAVDPLTKHYVESADGMVETIHIDNWVCYLCAGF